MTCILSTPVAFSNNWLLSRVPLETSINGGPITRNIFQHVTKKSCLFASVPLTNWGIAHVVENILTELLLHDALYIDCSMNCIGLKYFLNPKFFFNRFTSSECCHPSPQAELRSCRMWQRSVASSWPSHRSLLVPLQGIQVTGVTGTPVGAWMVWTLLDYHD